MPVGQTKDVGWEIGVSRTVAGSAEDVWDLLTSSKGTRLWLGSGLSWPAEKGTAYELDDGTTGEVRSFRPRDRIRLTWQPPSWDHESTVQVAITDKGDTTGITFHQERLADADERERQRRHWAGIMDAIEAALGGA
jgi:uncharacterized protein YndB with AHSA1/START domain